jgi:hypothetical protein
VGRVGAQDEVPAHIARIGGGGRAQTLLEALSLRYLGSVRGASRGTAAVARRSTDDA